MAEYIKGFEALMYEALPLAFREPQSKDNRDRALQGSSSTSSCENLVLSENSLSLRRPFSKNAGLKNQIHRIPVENADWPYPNPMPNPGWWVRVGGWGDLELMEGVGMCI